MRYAADPRFPFGVRISARGLRQDGRILNVALYLACRLRDFL